MLLRRSLLWSGLILLFSAEVLRVYFIMPFPGSQSADTLELAYFLDKNIRWFRFAGLLLLLPGLWAVLRQGRRWHQIGLGVVLLFYGVVVYLFNFRFLADKMFYQPTNKHLYTANESKVDTNHLVIGIVMNGEARAYPIEIIGYHHQVLDSISGNPVMVTYCTVCRTGRIYSPLFQHHMQHFRLVGMDHFNAMFEDADTRSWWRQATGEAVAGPLKGSQLQEWPSEQMRLASWIRQHPRTLILQPDSLFQQQYDDLKGYDAGTLSSHLEKRDSSSWKPKSWVIGMIIQGQAKAYDWNDVLNRKIVQDSFAGLPIVLVLEADRVSFHAWSRQVNGQTLDFTKSDSLNGLMDKTTKSNWNWEGVAVSGPLRGSRLDPVQAYQEFWHSWKTFHPKTLRYADSGP